VLLGVFSALVRLDVDPWEEPAKLARLPEGTATRSLAALITALSDGPAARPDPGAIAPRLMALLPRWGAPTLPGAGAVTHCPAVRNVIYYVLFMVVMPVGQWLIASRQSPAQVDKAPMVSSGTVLPHPPPPNSGE
jgi:hypothetical protein